MSEQSTRIALITDSTSDIPADLIKQYDIHVAPQCLIWGTEELRDLFDITPAEFYARLPNDPNHPKSSQPTAQDFVNLIEKIDADEVVIITISNQMSGTIASARQASEMVKVPVHTYDSLSVSMGLGWQVLAAARARGAGADVAGMLKAAQAVRENLFVMFTVDTLEYLHRGGRIGGAAKLVGTALNLKPSLYIDHTVGRIEALEKIRTRKKALARTYEVAFEHVDTSRPLHVAVQHGNAEAEAQAIADQIRAEYNPVELLVGDASPVIGTHGGPGVLGICMYYE